MPPPIGPGLPPDPATPAYTRTQALADGLLIDISDDAQGAYFRCPMAVSAPLFYNYCSPPYNLLAHGQSLSGRIRDMLAHLITAIHANPTARQLTFTVPFVMLPGNQPVPTPVQITARLDSGDDGTPVITLSLPEDDTPQK